ncbi:hypothetical protein FisN_4Lu432 [Fistulifera solaris]|uniref:Uncharacterized protein n=1 Tax=Fistulifera solaris TaxID=1519565 RepID=A0A1Z5JZQ8_FISSO|nr:hypothetical protein FisN_4Lu432 [Fistulifera solaris]|eukprot:GAX19389.1 hypothetical protein FisN_4Lu432 [Fistulifera solaris]
MTARTRSAIKRKAEALEASDSNKTPKRLFSSSCGTLPDNGVTADAIIACKKELFPDAARLDAVLPSVFSLFFLTSNKRYDYNESPLLDLLRAFVAVEAVSADPSYGVNKKTGQRRVAFSTHDCSSVVVPVDREGETSTGHQHKAISALTKVVLCVKSLTDMKDAVIMNTTMFQMRDLINFLGAVDKKENSIPSSTSLLEECAKAVGIENTKRIEKVMGDYKKEVENVLDRIMGRVHEVDLLLAERRLIEKLGHGIRYYLRKLFNCAPPRLTPKDIHYEERSARYSKITEFVSMKVASKADNAAVEDNCISAIVSSALFHVNNFFGLQSLLDEKLEKPLLKETFFAQPDLRFHLKGTPISLDDDQLAQILTEIEYAYKFLAAAKACKFLVSLWTAPKTIRISQFWLTKSFSLEDFGATVKK